MSDNSIVTLATFLSLPIDIYTMIRIARRVDCLGVKTLWTGLFGELPLVIHEPGLIDPNMRIKQITVNQRRADILIIV